MMDLAGDFPKYCCYLERLPEELFVNIISLLSLQDVGNLCLTGSGAIRTRIINWIMSNSLQRKILTMIGMPVTSLVTADGLDTWKIVTGKFGVLARRVSIGNSNRSRLRLLSCWYDRLEALISGPNQTWCKFLSRTGLASALASFTYGWDIVEFDRILGWLREIEEGLWMDSNRLMRLYHWQFLNTDQCRGSWTAWILKHFTHQRSLAPLADGLNQDYEWARLMLCMFGPAQLQLEAEEVQQLSTFQKEILTKVMGRPDYQGLQGFQSRSYQYAKARFADLGKAISCLLLSNLISHRDVISILHSLFNHFILETDNQAACLLFSCERLLEMYLGQLCLHAQLTGDFHRLAEILVSLTVTCRRLNNSLDQGMENILQFIFEFSESRDSDKMLIVAYMVELRRRLELNDVSPATISELGAFATNQILKKNF